MISVVIGVACSILGLLVYYVRVMSVAIDEKSSILNNPELKSRYEFAYQVSEKLEKIWPIVEPVDQTSWAKSLSNICLLVVLTLLLSAGAFQSFFSEHAGFLLFSLFIFASLSNGLNSVESYKNIKPYLPVIMPAAVFHGLTLLMRDHPQIAESMIFPGLTYDQSKIVGALLAFVFVFLIPYPLAKFDVFFTKLVARSTLFFTKDLLRLGVSAKNKDDVAYRKIAKETVAFTLKVAVTLLGLIAYITHMP